MVATVRPRRSMLYMPGSNTRALEKAKTLTADGFILDLEDAVAPNAKAEARGDLGALLSYPRQGLLLQFGGVGKAQRVGVYGQAQFGGRQFRCGHVVLDGAACLV